MYQRPCLAWMEQIPYQRGFKILPFRSLTVSITSLPMNISIKLWHCMEIDLLNPKYTIILVPFTFIVNLIAIESNK